MSGFSRILSGSNEFPVECPRPEFQSQKLSGSWGIRVSPGSKMDCTGNGDVSTANSRNNTKQIKGSTTVHRLILKELEISLTDGAWGLLLHIWNWLVVLFIIKAICILLSGAPFMLKVMLAFFIFSKLLKQLAAIMKMPQNVQTNVNQHILRIRDKFINNHWPVFNVIARKRCDRFYYILKSLA